MSIDIVPIFG